LEIGGQVEPTEVPRELIFGKANVPCNGDKLNLKTNKKKTLGFFLKP